MKFTRHFLLVVLVYNFTLIFFSIPAQAQSGIFELSASASVKRSQIDANNFTDSESSTGGISYYFGESSALELSFTSGRTTSKVKPATSLEGYTIKVNYGIVGIDFIWSFASRASSFQPYIKLGTASVIEKNYLFQLDNDQPSLIPGETGAVPSAGVGCKILFTKTLALKIGLDAWASDISQSSNATDFAGRVGISWFL